MQEDLTLDQLAAIKRLDTCAVADAIETFGVRLRNEGYTDGSIRSVSPQMAPMVGYATTVRIRCSNPPAVGRTYLERTDWWSYLLSVPAPRVVVIEDVDEKVGTGAFIGELHALILRSLGCVGVVTNGAVRGVPGIEAAGLPVFAATVTISRAFAHIVEFGKTAEIAGLSIRPGDLLHGDRHGVLSVPREIAAEVPAAAERLVERRKKVFDLCRQEEFTVEKLCTAVKGIFDFVPA
jgi:regulator of RNase E activity RraA